MAETSKVDGVAMAKYDLTNTLAPFMDLHFMFPLIDFLSSNEMYDEKQLLAAKLDLLKPTSMTDFAVEIYQSLNGAAKVPAEFETRRAAILDALAAAKASCKPILALLEDQDKVVALQNDSLLTAVYLEQHHGVTASVLEGLYTYAKLQYECGNYQDCLTYLTYYGVLVPTGSDKYMNALWGKLAAEILIFRWEDALADITRLNEAIDNSGKPALEQLQQRTWLLHWSLFVFAWHEEGRDAIVDFMMQSRCLEAIQTNAPWLMRYLAAGVILHKKRRQLIKELLRIISVDDKSYRDPIIEFLECLFVHFDFDQAQTQLLECKHVLASDFFLYEKNMADFMENARLLTFEIYCRIHQTIDITMLAEKLAMNEKGDAERWIVDLIRNARLDAKIDSQQDVIVMDPRYDSVYRQVITKTKDLAARTTSMISQFDRLGGKRQQRPLF
ncbi:eukaryotic translation initiation factor 3 [Achlya hypogyna]|uniref:Eukaryotic translation initiation factor 3 subunit E n=1 Tax=Achlya hypogyna TaxID=1202772 RepID=A0A1V9ZGP2_ACHHY|nr:eukaryotic translation initiation factor 3 [Achlya hypogyna]